MKKLLTALGEVICRYFKSWHETFIFWGEVVYSLGLLFKNPRKLRWKNFSYYFDSCGASALGIVLLICFLLGITLAFQAAIQLRQFGADIYVVDLVGFSMLKEFGPLMVALIATGRAGSSFAAEIGSMKAEEEISALTTMGISPVRYLVAPKLLAMMLAMPLLIIFGDAAGIAGGLAVCKVYMGMTTEVYLSRVAEVLPPSALVLGAFKGVFFGAMITLVGCREGFRSAPDSQGVGRAATSAVVRSILFLIILDTLITMIYSLWGY